MTSEEVYKILSQPIPEDFLEVYEEDGKSFTSFNAQYAINLLNETLGIDGWITTDEILQQGQASGRWLVVMKVKINGEHIDAIGYGASSSAKPDTAYKAAKTSAFKNACRYIGIGNELYFRINDKVVEQVDKKIESTDVANNGANELMTVIQNSKSKSELENVWKDIDKTEGVTVKNVLINAYNKKLMSLQ